MDPWKFAKSIQAGANCGRELLSVMLPANLVAVMFQALSATVRVDTETSVS
jgi:Mn2+/Fe2+ NRAMP family transporter